MFKSITFKKDKEINVLNQKVQALFHTQSQHLNSSHYTSDSTWYRVKGKRGQDERENV